MQANCLILGEGIHNRTKARVDFIGLPSLASSLSSQSSSFLTFGRWVLGQSLKN